MSHRVIDLLNPATHDDPWELYTWLREEAPMYWDEINEIWCVSRYDDVIAIARDPATFTSSEGNRAGLPPDPSLINQDGHRHQVLRGNVAEFFSPKNVAKLEPFIRETVGGLLDACGERGECEFVSEVGMRLPMRLIGHLISHPPEDDDMLQAWVDRFTQGGQGPQYVTDDVDLAFIEFAAYHEAMVERRRDSPAHDLMTTWLKAKVDGELYPPELLLFEHTLLLVGGSETTRNAISGGLEQLLKEPAQRDWLAAHPEGLANAAEEMIRWVTPFHNMARAATRDVEFRGQLIKEGQKVIMLYPAANRDPRRFTNPDQFDVQRVFTHKSVAFGYGAHFCLGAALARLQVRVVVEEFLRRFPKATLAGPSTWNSSSFVRGPKFLPMILNPA
jgi:cytochrome P450 family 142 subfamily A polypeptide 1